MEMINVPQNPADGRAVQEGVVEPHCAMAPREEWEGKWENHRDTPSAGIREISHTQKLSSACSGMEEGWPVIFSETQEEIQRVYIFLIRSPEVDGMVDYICSSYSKQSDSSLTQCICTVVSGG